jgi:hypothetical protein
MQHCKEQQLWKNRHEQTMEIHEMVAQDRIQPYHRNEEDLLEKKQWEQITFLHQ